MDESIPRTNEFFGGLIPGVYRVFLTHGEMDPKRSLGPSQDLNDQSPVVVMSRKIYKIFYIMTSLNFFLSLTVQSYGRDFGSPSETDYSVLIETKQRARELIIQWIFDSIDEIPTEPTQPDGSTTPVPAIDA